MDQEKSVQESPMAHEQENEFWKISTVFN